MTLTPFSRSQEGSDCWIMACLHAICWKNGWILTKLAQLCCWDRDKNWLDFLWPWSHFQVYTRAMTLENGLSTPYLIKELMNLLTYRYQSSRKRRIRRIFTPIFAFVRVKFPSEDSYLRSIATRRPNWTSKTYRGLPKFLLSVKIDTRDVQKLSKSPPTFNELYDVCPAYLLEIRYLYWLSFKDVPLSACGSLLTSVSSVAAPF